jgi:hypothetical protein
MGPRALCVAAPPCSVQPLRGRAQLLFPWSRAARLGLTTPRADPLMTGHLWPQTTPEGDVFGGKMGCISGLGQWPQTSADLHQAWGDRGQGGLSPPLNQAWELQLLTYTHSAPEAEDW